MKISNLFVPALMVLALFSCTPESKVEEATLNLDKTYADLGGESGSSAVVTAETNCSSITATKEKEAGAEWFSVTVEGLTITVTSLSANDGEQERWANVIVRTDDKEKSGTAVKQFTVRQTINSDAVKIIPEKTQPILSAAAYGESSIPRFKPACPPRVGRMLNRHGLRMSRNSIMM